MTIHLSKDLEQIVHDAVKAGFYACEDDVIRDALTQLRPSMPTNTASTGKKPNRARPAAEKKPLTREEFDQQLLAMGLLSRLPDTAADFDDPDDEPVEIKGEPLSETVIRERR